MKRAHILLLIAAVLALTAASAFVVHRFFAPTVLRIAVGPVGSQDMKLVANILQTFAREKYPIRLRIVPTDNPVASAEALRAGRVDAAFVRSDGNLPPNATTVAIMHHDAFMLFAPARSGITSIGDLKGKKIAIVRGYQLNEKLADIVLQDNGLKPEDTIKERIRIKEIKEAITNGQADVVLLVAPASSPAVAQLFRDLYDDDKPPTLLAIPSSEALAQRNPTLEAASILKGTFGGSPLQPERSVETISVTHRLVVDRGMKEAVAENFARSLFDIRQAVAAEFPNFVRVEAPDTEKLGPLVVHPGAAAYFDGETKTFIEQYGEWIYILIMVVSLAGSVLAAFLSRRLAHRKPPGKAEIDKMLLLLREARGAATLNDLDRIQSEADEVFGRTVERAAGAEFDEAVLSAFTIALSEVRTAVEERRGMLSKEFVGLAG